MIRDERKRRHPAQRGQNHPIARRLAEIHGVGPQTAGILATEVFYRGFKNRREVASYVGLTPTPYNSGTMVRDQGISKAGNRRARAVAVELAWIWLRNQPESKLSRWFRTRVGDANMTTERPSIAPAHDIPLPKALAMTPATAAASNSIGPLAWMLPSGTDVLF